MLVFKIIYTLKMKKKHDRKSIAHHVSSETIQLEITDSFIRAWQNRNEPSNTVTRKGLILRFIGVCLSVISSLLMTYRANIDGKLSFYALCCRIISFSIMSFIFCCDDRFTSKERCLYSWPKIGGILMSVIQMVGLFLTSDGVAIFRQV